MIKTILLYLWQLPQNLIGLIVIALCKGERRDVLDSFSEGTITYYASRGRLFGSGVTLGQYIITPNVGLSLQNLMHESGHTVQSKYLGWLYLVVIALPSLLGNIWDRIFHKNWKYQPRVYWYYSLPWEKWADHIGHVYRWF